MNTVLLFLLLQLLLNAIAATECPAVLEGETIIKATEKRDLELVKCLIKIGANLNSLRKNGDSALRCSFTFFYSLKFNSFNF